MGVVINDRREEKRDEGLESGDNEIKEKKSARTCTRYRRTMKFSVVFNRKNLLHRMKYHH